LDDYELLKAIFRIVLQSSKIFVAQCIMAHITSVSHGNFSSVPRRSYLSTEAFNGAIYSYSTALVNQVFVGTLTLLSGATGANCPAGRILHETGKKLFPGANNGVNDYMVSVYDPISMLTGFINPNNPNFSLMNTDRANFLLDGPNGTGTGLSASARANALYTRGDVLAGGRMDISGNAVIYGNEYISSSVSTMGNVYIQGNDRIGGNLSTLGNVFIGNNLYFRNNSTIGNANLTSGTISSGYKVLTVATPYVTANSEILLTYTGLNFPGYLASDTLNAGTSFRIVSTNPSDVGQVNWVILNHN